MPLSTVAAVVGIAGGVQQYNNAKKAGDMMGSGGSGLSAWSSSGGDSQAASMLQQLISQGPAGIMEDKAFKAANAASMGAVQRKLSSQGQHLSGNEVLALNDSTNKNAMDFYNNQVSQLGQLSGSGFNPATAASNNMQYGQVGDKAISQGIGSLNQLYNGKPLESLYNWGSGLFNGGSSSNYTPYNGVSSQVGSGGGGMSVAPATGLSSFFE
jgi:hypothetical protein